MRVANKTGINFNREDINRMKDMITFETDGVAKVGDIVHFSQFTFNHNSEGNFNVVGIEVEKTSEQTWTVTEA